MKKQFQQIMLAVILTAGSFTAHAQLQYWRLTGNTNATNSSILGTLNNINLNLYTNSKNRMTFISGGNVGIGNFGTGNPPPSANYGVHIRGGLGSGNVQSQGLYIQRADMPPTNQDDALAISFSSNSYSTVGVGGGSCNFILFPSSNTPQPDMSFSTNNLAPQMIIKFSGKVGIAQPNPSNKLDIVTTVPTDGIRVTQAGPTGAVSLQLKNSTASGRLWGMLSLGSGDADGSGNFGIYDLTSGNNRLFISGGGSVAAGNIGIGTVTPNNRVEINSGVAARSGLTFTNLTSNTPAGTSSTDFDCSKVLTVDSMGEVILVDLNTCLSSSRLGQEQQLADQQAQINELKSEINSLKAMLASGSVSPEKVASSIQGSLTQITPNPFSKSATISFSLPSDAANAQLVITDLSGKVLETFPLSAGATEQIVNGGKFLSGSYVYSLRVNGKIIDSKQMVIAK